MKKPRIFYVDDEVRNLAVFEGLLGDEYELYTYESAIKALGQVKELDPWLIITDQRMPQMQGLEFLEICSQIVPRAIRMVVTGQTDESTIVQLIRRAKIFDYVTKPWDVEVLQSQIEKAISYYKITLEKESALRSLEEKNLELQKTITDLVESKSSEASLEKELSAWLPHPLLKAIREKNVSSVVNKYQEKDIVGITYDIVNSSQFHGVFIEGRSLRSHVYYMFLRSLLKYDGVLEASGGDSVYAHFGAFLDIPDSGLRAYSVAEEFRQSLNAFRHLHKLEITCGISIHFAKKAQLMINEVSVDTPKGIVIKKSFETTSPDIDLLFRVERLGHSIKGTNIFSTEEILLTLPDSILAKFVTIGRKEFRGQKNPVNIYVNPDSSLSVEETEFLFGFLKKEAA